MSNKELLQFAVENGIINIETVQKQFEMNERKKYLEKHKYSVWEDKYGIWHTYLPDERKGRIHKKRNTRNEIEDVIIGFWKEQEENPSIMEVFDEWNDRKLNLKKISSASYLRNKQTFNRHYEEFGKRRIKNVTQIEIEEFLEEQIPKFNLTSKAFSGLKTVTRGFLKRARKRGLICFNVEELFQELDTSDSEFCKNIKEDSQEVFSEEELPIIMDYLRKNLDLKNLGIILMFLTGIRVGELVALKHSDFEGNTFKIRRTETRYKENGVYVYGIKESPKTDAGIRTAIIPDDYIWVAEKLRLQNPFDEYIFMQDGKRMTTNFIRRRMYCVCKNVNIIKKSPHKARKTYGSILLDNGIDKKLITDVMGHTDISCTEGFYHKNRKSIEKKSEILSSIPEFISKR